jgi:hypothetical protein
MEVFHFDGNVVYAAENELMAEVATTRPRRRAPHLLILSVKGVFSMLCLEVGPQPTCPHILAITACASVAFQTLFVDHISFGSAWCHI